MKEYIITYTSKGKRQQRRVFAYNPSDAHNRVNSEEGSISLIKTKEVK